MGVAATIGLGMILMTRAFPESQKGFAIGLSMGVIAIGQAVGPVAGGLILEYANWHWLFLINVPFGVASVVMTILFAASDEPGKINNPNWMNVALLIAGLSLSLFALNQMHILDTMTFIAALLAGLVLLGLFIYTSFKLSKPLISRSVLTNLNFIKITTIRFLFVLFLFATLMLLPLYLQNILGFSPLKTGLILLISTIMIGVCSPLSGLLLDRVGFKMPLLISVMTPFISLIAFYFCGLQFNATVFTVGLLAFGIATGIAIPTSINAALAEIEPKLVGTGIGLFYTIGTSGAVVGVAICGVTLSSMSHHCLLENIANVQAHISPANLPQLIYAASGSQALISGPYVALAHQAFIKAMHDVLGIELLFIAFACYLCISLKKTKLQK